MGPKIGELLDLEPDQIATTVTRVLVLDGEPWASMRDVVHPDVELPSRARIRQALQRGQMVLDVLKEQGVPVAYARTHIAARVLTVDDRVGKALGVSDTSAALELEHVTCTSEGVAVEYSTDIFLPGRLDLHVMRYLEEPPPYPPSNVPDTRARRAGREGGHDPPHPVELRLQQFVQSMCRPGTTGGRDR